MNYLRKVSKVIKIYAKAKMSSNNDCPICMEAIETMAKNYCVTECGHCFHTNCLMQSVAHNGFGCPYCRTKMAEEPEPEEESVWSEEEDVEPFEDIALNAFRWFSMRIEGEEIPEDDVEEENDENDEEEEELEVPSVQFIAQKLSERRITPIQMVKALLLQHEEYQSNSDCEDADDKIFGEMRIIISNFTRDQEQEQNQVSQQIEVN